MVVAALCNREGIDLYGLARKVAQLYEGECEKVADVDYEMEYQVGEIPVDEDYDVYVEVDNGDDGNWDDFEEQPDVDRRSEIQN